MKALFTYSYGDEKMNSIRDLGYEVLYESERNIEYRDEYADVDALVCYNPFNKLDIKKMKSLKYIQLSSIGINQLPEDIDPDILVGNNQGGYSIPIGEWTVFKMLEIYKDARYFYGKQKDHQWKMNTNLLELKDKKIGFIGTGTLAMETAKRLQGFGSEIIGFSQSGREKPFFDQTYTMNYMDQMVPELDIVVLAIPHTDKTYHLMSEKYIELMKAGSVLINISRGQVLDESALIRHHEKFLGIALDVFETEPLPEDHPFWDLDNVYVTPHNCWISEMRNERRFEMIYENMKLFIADQPIINKVDLKRGY